MTDPQKQISLHFYFLNLKENWKKMLKLQFF